jgi:hypothetical protein
MADNTMPNRAANMEQAEGSRENVNRDESDRTDEAAAHPGITNRSDEDESRNQQRVPPRGDTKNGGHA